MSEYDAPNETVTVEIPVEAAQVIVGTFDVDMEIAAAEGNEEFWARLEEWQQIFVDVLRERQESHFEEQGET